jgi:uncharacterized delta-60 repeat protein
MKTFLHYLCVAFIATVLTKVATAQPPTITSFSPDSGPIGSTVVITGTNFSPVAENNVVYIGRVKAVVTAASTTSLAVTVPAGPTDQPLSVTVNGSTAYSSTPFVVTSPCSNPTLSFARTSWIVPGSPFADIDGDGKVDFRSSKAPDSLSILRNLSVGDAIAFAPGVNFQTGSSNVQIFDWDGDGKLDLAVTNTDSKTFSLLRNTSSIGTISFAPKVDVPFTGSPTIIDWDGDGKLDLAVVNAASNTFSLLLNTSSIGNISFAPKVDVPLPGTADLYISDLNGDGKPDLASAKIVGQFRGTLSVYLNISTAGTLAFANKVDFPIQGYPGQVYIEDFDGDGKPDFLFFDYAYWSFSVLRNTSTGGAVSFEGAGQYTTPRNPSHLTIADLDRDGKPDLVMPGGWYPNFYFIVDRNTSTPGTISFASGYGYSAPGIYASDPIIGDLNGDGKPELIVTSVTGDNCSKDFTLTDILENTSTAGSLSFRGAQQFYFAGCSGVSPIGDLNADGKSELIINGFVSRNETTCSPCAPSGLPTFKYDGTMAVNPTCGNSDGALSIIPTRGTAPYLYSKDGGTTYVSGSDAGYTFNNLATGTYKLRLKDARGCESAIIEKRLASFNCPPAICNDPAFNPGTGANGDIRTTAIQSDGKIIIGGEFTSYNETGRNRIARLNTDGSLDAGFNPGTGADGIIYTTAIQSDGKIIIGGNFTAYNGTARNRIARLNTDGSLDASFNPGTGTNGYIATTAIQSDGKIIIGGQFTSYNGTARNYIARLNTDGTLDAGFNPGAGASNQFLATSILTAAIQSDGKIIIGGDFVSYNGTARNRIARLNTDGTLDASFNPGTGANSYILTTAIQSDGKIIIGGAFTSYDGTARNYVARLNTDGILDAGFNPGTGANQFIQTTVIQSDGKIIIGGWFTSYDGTVINRIARLNSDGTLDAGFNPGTGANSTIYTTSLQSDGKIIIGGAFTSYNGTGRNRIARAMNCAVSCTPPTFRNDGLIILDATCANNDGNINIIPTSGTAPFMYSINGGTTYVAGPNAGYGFQNLPSGTYKLRLKDAKGCESEIVEREVKRVCTTCTLPTFVNNGLIILDATCANNDGNINIIPTSGTAPFMYSINGGVTYVAGPNAGYGFQNLPSGTYKLRLKDAKGCESAIVERQVKLLCTTCTPPTFVNNNLIVLDASCGKSDGAINIIPTSGTPPFMYSINGGTTYVAGPNPGYGFQNLPAGTYQLRLKDARGCESVIVERTVRNYYNCPGTVSTNTSETSLVLSNKDVVSTYPNPNNGQFKLLFQNFQSPKAEVSIFDAKGTLIQKRSLNLTQNTIADFDIKGKAAGLYLIKVVTASGIKNMKIVVQ